ASELLVKPCNPSDTQKEQAHIQLMDLVSRPLPAWFYIGSEQPKDWIYADKFFRKTWDELQKRGLALAQSDNEKHYWSSKALGMLMMSVLADCCAGKTKVTATDQPDAYNTLGKCLAVEVGAEARHPREGEGALVSTEVLSPSLDAIPFANLIKLRKQESDKNGYQYKQLR